MLSQIAKLTWDLSCVDIGRISSKEIHLAAWAAVKVYKLIKVCLAEKRLLQ